MSVGEVERIVEAVKIKNKGDFTLALYDYEIEGVVEVCKKHLMAV